MLVKFLSFVVSVFSTARYKTVLLSCLALILSLTGITALVLRGSNPTQTAASSVQQSKDGVDTQSFTPDLHSTRQQKAKGQSGQAQSDNNTSNSSSANGSSQQPTNSAPAPNSSPKQPATPSTDVTLNVNTLSVAAGSSSDLVTAATTDNSSVTWSVIVDGGDANGHAVLAQTSGNSTSMQVTAASNLASGTMFKVFLSAHDASRNINITKTVIVTVQ